MCPPFVQIYCHPLWGYGCDEELCAIIIAPLARLSEITSVILTRGKNLLEYSAMIEQILHCIQDDTNN